MKRVNRLPHSSQRYKPPTPTEWFLNVVAILLLLCWIGGWWTGS